MPMATSACSPAIWVGGQIPGNPTVIAKNMEGGGSLRLDNWLYAIAPKDGVAGGEKPCRRRRHIFGIGKGPVWGPFVFQVWGSERLIVDCGVGVV